jgi:hypothetical protein
MSAESEGYVVMPPGNRQSSEASRYMLHRRECMHLVSTSGALEAAGHPKWCGPKRDLIDWTTQETGSPPAFCPTCMS